MRLKYVEPILFVYYVNMAMDMFISKELIFHKACLIKFNVTYCDIITNSKNSTYIDDQNLIHKQTASWDLNLLVARTFPAVFVTLFFGSWSDKVGRKFVILLPMVGQSINMAVYLCGAYYINSSIYYLIGGNIITSLFGEFALLIQACSSFISDVSFKEQRTRRIAMMEFSSNFARAVGPFIAGVMATNLGFVSVYALAVALTIFSLIYWIFLYETNVVETSTTTKDKIKMLVNIDRLRDIYDVLRARRVGNIRKVFYILLFTFVAELFCLMGVMSILVLYLMHTPLSMSLSHIGIFFAELNGGKALGLMLMNLVLVKWFHDFTFIIIAGLALALSSFLLAIANHSWQAFAICALSPLLAMAMPGIRSQLSKIVQPNEIASMFSLISCLELISTLLFGMLFNKVYMSTVSMLPGFNFYLMTVAAFLLAVAGGVLKWMTRNSGDFITMIEEDEKDAEDEHIINNIV